MDALKDIREKIAKLTEAGEEILKAADASGLTDEARANFDKTHVDLGQAVEMRDMLVRQMEAKARHAERVGVKLDEIEQSPDARADKEAAKRYVEDKTHTRLMQKYLRDGFDSFSREERTAYEVQVQGEQRQQGTTPDSAGGFIVGEEFVRRVEDAMLLFAGIRSVATVLRTATGEDLHYPLSDGTAEVGEIIGENSAHNDESVVFAELILGAYQYSSKIIRTSRQLLQDNFLTDFEGFLAGRLGERIGRIQSQHFTLGTGAGQPNGIVPQAGAGITAGAAAITADDLVRLIHVVDPAYAINGMFGMNWTTLGAIRALQTTEGLPIFNPVAQSVPGSIYGRPYFILQDMADVATGTLPVIYGALDKYIIRDALGMTLFRTSERYFEFNQVAFLGIMRSDGNLLNADVSGVNAPVKAMLMP